MKITNCLDRAQLDRLIELVSEQYSKVWGGEVSGYGQSQADELRDLEETAEVLRIMRDS